MCWGNCRLRESPSTFTTSVSHLTTSPGSVYISASLSTSSSSHELQLWVAILVGIVPKRFLHHLLWWEFVTWQIPTIIITDKNPPWWESVMVGICWVTLLSPSENSIRCRISLKIFIKMEIFNQRIILVVHKKLKASLYLMVRYGMERFWNPLSVNWDMHGLKYISTIEVRNAFFSSLKETKSDTGKPLQPPLAMFSLLYLCVGKKISVCGSPVPPWEEHLWVVCKGAQDSTHEVMIMTWPRQFWCLCL